MLPQLTDSFSELRLEHTDEHLEQRLVGTGEDFAIELCNLEAARRISDCDRAVVVRQQ